ncbi:50S ribosomal protein L23 [Candidatus Parcubacteria bacterium 4484_255]|nr:MAG: 50S ribosomal protein L23 [Candidatus Parcubacteria bacterium 4484_255]
MPLCLQAGTLELTINFMPLFRKKNHKVSPPIIRKKEDAAIKKSALSPKPKAAGFGSSDIVFGNLLLQPVITEKATILAGENNCYIFEVAMRANKTSIKKAITEIYNFIPIRVNIVKIKGKKVSYGRSRGRTKNKKRALVFLKKGDHIEFIKK